MASYISKQAFKSICRKNKTEKGYLCDKVNQPDYLNIGKKWCVINNDDVKKYSKKLGEPKKSRDYYWDYVKEENRLLNMNLYGNRIIYNSCNVINYLLNYFKYLLTILLILEHAMYVIGGGTFTYGLPHFLETIEFANLNNKEILIKLVGKLKELCEENLVDKGIYTQEDIITVITNLNEEINSIPDNNDEELGKYLDTIFRIAIDVIKSNPENNKYSTSVMEFFVNKIQNKDKMEAIKGANIVLLDGGKTKREIETNMSGYGRFSSHAKNATEITQQGNTDLLFDSYLHLISGSYILETGEEVSWFQFEGAPMPPGLNTKEVFENILSNGNINWKYYKYYADHFDDSIYYFAFSKIPGFSAQLIGMNYTSFNIALGTSKYTDTNPLFTTLSQTKDSPSYLNEIKDYPSYLWSSQQASPEIKPFNESTESHVLKYPIQSLNQFIAPRNIKFEYLKNNLTRLLGLHTDYFPTQQTLSLQEYKRSKIDEPNTTGYISHDINKGANLYIPTYDISALGSSLAIGRGGKHKKKTRKMRTSNKKRKNKRRTLKH